MKRYFKWAKSNRKIDVSILEDDEIHAKIRDTILSYIIFEAKYMPDYEIEETTMQVKGLLILKINHNKDRINDELYHILKSKMMYDVEISEYGDAARTAVKVIEKIIQKLAKNLETELYTIVGIKKKKVNIFKRLFLACISDQSDFNRQEPKNYLTKKEVNTLRQVKKLASTRCHNENRIRRINGTQYQKNLKANLTKKCFTTPHNM